MRQNNPANLRALVAAVVVVSFVVISSYIAFGTSSSKISNQNQGSGAASQAAASQNSTTYSYATETGQSTTTILTQNVTVQPTQGPPTQEDFGNNYFEPPSAILISADTLVWTNFKLGVTNNTSYFVGGSINYLVFPAAVPRLVKLLTDRPKAECPPSFHCDHLWRENEHRLKSCTTLSI